MHVEVERPARMRARAQDAFGELRCSVEAEGLQARVIQHEIDHLDGILILDRISREARREAMRALREARDGVARDPAGARDRLRDEPLLAASAARGVGRRLRSCARSSSGTSDVCRRRAGASGRERASPGAGADAPRPPARAWTQAGAPPVADARAGAGNRAGAARERQRALRPRARSREHARTRWSCARSAR